MSEGLWDELHRLDVAVYAAVAETPTPRLDRVMGRLSSAADYSRISLASAGLLMVAGGPSGRRAAARGLLAVALTSAAVNGLVKPLTRRRRPEPGAAGVPMARRVSMPGSASFPSGHTASAFAFALGVGRELPWIGVGLAGVAVAVGYSRVHTGVHYPGDVIAGALCGLVGVAASDRAFERSRGRA